MWDIILEKNSELSLSRQLYQYISRSILDGRIKTAEKLPSSRELANSLQVSRNTINEAYEMLKIEGYIESRPGSACHVTDCLSLALEKPPVPPAASSSVSPVDYPYDFRTGLAALDAFPRSTWRKTVSDTIAYSGTADLAYGSAKGHPRLCREIAGWLFRNRGMQVSEEEVFITSGASHALSMLVELLSRKNNTKEFLVEDPCHIGILKLLEQKNIPSRGISVDHHGIMVQNLPAQATPSGIYVTPSHQFPTGMILPASRRVELIRYAGQKNTYILEDDYDSEFRYEGPPVTPLYAMDNSRVIYIGTFSKSLYPALRIGFALLPAKLRTDWLHLRRYLDIQNPIFDQLALANFLKERKMDHHIRRTKKRYAAKRQLLVSSIRQYFGSHAGILGDACGIHLCLKIEGASFDRSFIQNCRQQGLALSTSSPYLRDHASGTDTLLLGYGNIKEEQIDRGVELLKGIISY